MCQQMTVISVMSVMGSAAEASRYLVSVQVAEADGNRTRQRRSAALTGFEDRGDHQVPKRLRVDSTAAALRRQAMQVPREQRDLPNVLGYRADLTRHFKRIVGLTPGRYVWEEGDA